MALRLIRWSRQPSQPAPADRAQSESEAATPRSRRANRAWIMVGLVLGVAGTAVLVIERSAGPPASTLPTPELEGEPDVYIESPDVSQYRRDGSLEYRLVADTASHYQTAALTRLENPSLTLLRRGDPPWHVSARRGVLRRPPAGAPEEVVSLEEKVVLEQTRDNGGTLRLSTPSLQVYPRRQYAETDRDVMIESVFGRTTAAGLQGDLQRDVLELLSMDKGPVHTVLEPDQFK